MILGLTLQGLWNSIINIKHSSSHWMDINISGIPMKVQGGRAFCCRFSFPFSYSLGLQSEAAATASYCVGCISTSSSQFPIIYYSGNTRFIHFTQDFQAISCGWTPKFKYHQENQQTLLLPNLETLVHE